jgi:hypothetical protein
VVSSQRDPLAENPKAETRNTKQIRMKNDECSKGRLEDLDFGFVSTFGLRTSQLLVGFSTMKTKLALVLAICTSTFLAAALPAEAHIFRRFAGQGYVYSGQSTSGDGTATAGLAGVGGYQGLYYDVAWGMPLAVLVPPTARSQTDYSWGVPSVRISPIDSQFQYQYPGPSSSYRMGQFPPAPPQPSDTHQMGNYSVRGP